MDSRRFSTQEVLQILDDENLYVNVTNNDDGHLIDSGANLNFVAMENVLSDVEYSGNNILNDVYFNDTYSDIQIIQSDQVVQRNISTNYNLEYTVPVDVQE